MTGRTIGPFEPQRQLVYKDGMLISALFGTSEHTPKYSMIAPEEVERIDVMYGPYPRSIRAIRSAASSPTRRRCRSASSCTAICRA